MIRPLYIILILMPVLLWTAPAEARALFCLKTPNTRAECIYNDPRACQQKASSVDGICTVNENAIDLPAGLGNYCYVDINRSVECRFMNFRGCRNYGRNKNGICVRSPERRFPPESFRYDLETFY